MLKYALGFYAKPPRSQDLYAEYAAGQTREARFVKACDKLQLMIKVLVYQQWGAGGLGEFWQNDFNFPDTEFASVCQLTAELHQRHQEGAKLSGEEGHRLFGDLGNHEVAAGKA